MGPTKEERALVRRLAELIQGAERAGRATTGAEFERLVREAKGPAALAETLDVIPTKTPAKRWAALGVLAHAARSDRLKLVDQGELIAWEAFSEYAAGLGLETGVIQLLYIQALDYWKRLHPAPPPESRVATYLALHRNRIVSRSDVIGFPSTTLAQMLGISPDSGLRLSHGVLRDETRKGPLGFVLNDQKWGRHRCCPPLHDPNWEERFDFFGANSRLSKIIEALKENISARIRAMFESIITSEVTVAAGDFGVGDPSLYDTHANAAPFYGSGEAIQGIGDLTAKTTRPEAEEWLLNIRRQLEQVRAQLRVNSIESYIWTSDEDSWGTGGGDGDKVYLEIRGSFGSINVRPAPSGGGFPIDSSNYNDGALAFEFFGSNHPYETPIPYADGTIPVLDITGFRLAYESSNDWYFEKAEIWFRYKVNGHSRLLTEGQPASDEYMRDDDLVHHDDEAGWVHYGDEFGFGIQPASRLARTQQRFGLLQGALNLVEASLSSDDINNLYVRRGGDIIDLLGKAAVHTRNGEHELARARYADVLAILSELVPNEMGDLDRELLFAVHVLMAASYVASNLMAHAYASYLDAGAFAAGDAESRSYLWHALASLFLRWGDQLYAAAGGEYVARLVALDRYRKVTDAAMNLTYGDGREDEVVDLWVDLARADGALPANLAGWRGLVAVRTTSYAGPIPLYGRPTPVAGVEIHPGIGQAQGHFLRIKLDVSEVRLKRGELDLLIGVPAATDAGWHPNAVRLQARVAAYNPSATPSGLRGAGQDILVLERALAPPESDGAMHSWSAAFGAVASSSRRLRIAAPQTCAVRLIQRMAQLRIDQILAHLNVYGVHDEYVPNGRFLALQRLAVGLADRSVYFWSRYIDFLTRAEAAALEEMDTAFLAELGDANLDLARERVAQASLEVAAAEANVAAAGKILSLSSQTLQQFQQTYQIGLLRVLNSVNLSLWPPGVGMNLGGFVGSLSGADGYDAQFHTRELEYEAGVERARAAAEAAEFQRRLAEIEQLIAADSLAIEEIRYANVLERLDFLRNRALSATAWYAMANLYREMAEAKLQTAARWAWMAERALEFEINVPVSVIRMDYHLLPLGAERLRGNLDDLSVTLAEFRDRYRDVPNIIEREFRFSADFPQEFRALTSQATAPPAIAVGNGVRAVEFRTNMASYDSRLPGRYAFGRVLGVEIELQTDVATSVFSGHIENAREVVVIVDGGTRTLQVSESMVRVPAPVKEEIVPFCVPYDDLDNASFGRKEPVPQPRPLPWDLELVKIPQEFLDLLESYGMEPGRVVSSADSAGGGSRARGRRAAGGASAKRATVKFAGMAAARSGSGRFSVAPSLRARGVVQMAECMTALEPVVGRMLAPYAPDWRLQGSKEAPAPEAARSLLSRAKEADVRREEIAYLADGLFSGAFAKEAKRVRAVRLDQIARLRDRFASRGLRLAAGDLDAMLALRGREGLVVERLQETVNGVVFGRRGSRSWERYRFQAELPPEQVIFRDISSGHGDQRSRPLDILPDYLIYPAGGPQYGLRLKRHDADSLTLSAYQLREDVAVFNPYNAGDQLGVFENTGIDSCWRLTLRALPASQLSSTPQWDKIREIIMRVWYHAAYERQEGYRLASVLEPQIVRWNSSKVLSISLYRDFYDDFVTLLGDYDETDPESLAAVRSFTDESHSATGGWIPFVVDNTLVQASGQRIAAAAVAFTAPEPWAFPAYVWRLRRDVAGPVIEGTATEAPGGVAARLSAAAPAGFGGLEAGGTWYLQLARADNPGVGLGPLRDIEIIFELEPR